MTDLAIRVENLSKQYKIGRARQRHNTLRDALTDAFRRKGANGATETFWALKDVSFEVKRGEVVGIIGRNGAGKSTLLKILSQITEPTSGRAEIHGRVGSLLEVGTGFHPELTGRENIYLNGAILGMRREEIRRAFDEIVAFAEIDKFLDTPVKRYSSGMYVRLAFAVAAHLEPEILLVDEVLAVGDAAFQKKCLGKMGEVAREGRSIMFVSHNTTAIQRLCEYTALIDKGQLILWGETGKVLERYLSSSSESLIPGHWFDIKPDNPKKTSWFSGVFYSSKSPTIGNHAFVEGPLEVRLRIESTIARDVSSLSITFYNEHGTKLVNCDTAIFGETIYLDQGQSEFTFQIKQLNLNPGIYTLGLYVAGNQHLVIDHNSRVGNIEVLESPFNESYYRPKYDGLVSNRFTFVPE
jgi:lipopolysaccharide transport system ATP-binding protein